MRDLKVLGLVLLAVPLMSAGASARELSLATIRHYGKALAFWGDLRMSCGDGQAFEGAEWRINSAIAQLQAAAANLSAPGQAFAANLTGDGGADFRGTCASLGTVVSADDLNNSIHLAESAAQALRATGFLQNKLNQAIRAAPAGSPIIAQGNALRALVNRAHYAASRLHRVVSCRRSRDELAFVINQTIAAVPEETPLDLPNTLESQPLVLPGGNCGSLEGVANSLVRTVGDTNEIILSGRSYYERAVISQMVVEYIRKHGGRTGTLSPSRAEKLQDLLNTIVQRFIAREEELARRNEGAGG